MARRASYCWPTPSAAEPSSTPSTSWLRLTASCTRQYSPTTLRACWRKSFSDIAGVKFHWRTMVLHSVNARVDGEGTIGTASPLQWRVTRCHWLPAVMPNKWALPKARLVFCIICNAGLVQDTCNYRRSDLTCHHLRWTAWLGFGPRLHDDISPHFFTWALAPESDLIPTNNLTLAMPFFLPFQQGPR